MTHMSNYNSRVQLANYFKSEEILFNSDTKHDFHVDCSNINTNDKQLFIKIRKYSKLQDGSMHAQLFYLVYFPHDPSEKTELIYLIFVENQALMWNDVYCCKLTLCCCEWVAADK